MGKINNGKESWWRCFFLLGFFLFNFFLLSIFFFCFLIKFYCFNYFFKREKKFIIFIVERISSFLKYFWWIKLINEGDILMSYFVCKKKVLEPAKLFLLSLFLIRHGKHRLQKSFFEKWLILWQSIININSIIFPKTSVLLMFTYHLKNFQIIKKVTYQKIVLFF